MNKVKKSNNWYKALNIEERTRILRMNLEKIEPNYLNQSLCERRYREWVEKPTFNDESLLMNRISTLQITREDFKKLLGVESELIEQFSKEDPLWIDFLVESLRHYFSSDYDHKSSLTNPKNFGLLVDPLVQNGIKLLSMEISKLNKEYPHISFDSDKIITLFFSKFAANLLSIVSRTLILELHVSKLQGDLPEGTSDERFVYFMDQLKTLEKVYSIFEEYPVLAQQCSMMVMHWVSFVTEFLSNLCLDWNDICSTFGKETLGQIESISTNVGDTHNQGRSVIFVEFESGLKLVYKPRSLEVDVHFNKLLNWLNQHSAGIDLYALKVINKQSHGWVEFIEHKECPPKLLKHFYKRQGSYLALLYALEATDFHYENIIACGEYPVLVDLESLFQPRIDGNDQQISNPAQEFIDHSVLRVGILPQKVIYGGDHSEALDMSGMGGERGQMTPTENIIWENAGTDEMHISRKKLPMERASNLPYSEEKSIRVKDYLEEIIEGFSGTYNQLSEHHNDLISEGGILDMFENDTIRVILRNTQFYGRILSESYHPDLLRDAIDRDFLFEGLWGAASHLPVEAIAAENKDLWRGDVPIFHTTPTSHNIYTSDGVVIESVLNKSGLKAVKDTIKKLNVNDLRRQEWCIRASMTSQSLATEISKKKEIMSDSQAVSTFKLSEDILVEVNKVAQTLERLAVKNDKSISWVGISFIDDKSWMLAPVSGELYDGTSGIALFFAYVGTITGNEYYTKLSEDIISNLIQSINPTLEASKAHQLNFSLSIGGYSGLGSIIYALTHIGYILNNKEFISYAESMLPYLSPLIEQDKVLDVLGGTAGCLGGLISLYSLYPTPEILSIMNQCGEKLISSAKLMDTGFGWKTTIDCSQPLTGFSHGVAGISWALLELFNITGDEKLKEYALGGIEYENSAFLKKFNNWADFRVLDANPSSTINKDSEIGAMTAWCHGAPGIGLTRLRAIEILDLDEATHIYKDIETALETTKIDGFSFGHSLCHGDLGNLDLFLKASKVLPEDHWKQELRNKTQEVLQSGKELGWLCGTPSFVETPGLMMGLSGIGYQLLRLALSDQVPSVLLLEPPIQN